MFAHNFMYFNQHVQQYICGNSVSKVIDILGYPPQGSACMLCNVLYTDCHHSNYNIPHQ